MPDLRVGKMVPLLEISRAWLVDPVGEREGPGEIVVRDGILDTTRRIAEMSVPAWLMPIQNTNVVM